MYRVHISEVSRATLKSLPVYLHTGREREREGRRERERERGREGERERETQRD